MVVRFDQADHFDLTCKVGVQRVQAYILSHFPDTVNSGCVTTRPNDGGGISEHNEGRAGDTGIRPIEHVVSGDAVVAFLYENREALGCQSIIYNGRVYSSDRGDGWRPYLANRHNDHVHWELNWDGARALTSWFIVKPPEPTPTPPVPVTSEGESAVQSFYYPPQKQTHSFWIDNAGHVRHAWEVNGFPPGHEDLTAKLKINESALAPRGLSVFIAPDMSLVCRVVVADGACGEFRWPPAGTGWGFRLIGR